MASPKSIDLKFQFLSWGTQYVPLNIYMVNTCEHSKNTAIHSEYSSTQFTNLFWMFILIILLQLSRLHISLESPKAFYVCTFVQMYRSWSDKNYTQISYFNFIIISNFFWSSPYCCGFPELHFSRIFAPCSVQSLQAGLLIDGKSTTYIERVYIV